MKLKNCGAKKLLSQKKLMKPKHNLITLPKMLQFKTNNLKILFQDNWLSRKSKISLFLSLVSQGYNTMADGGQIMRFKLDSNVIFLYNWPPCALNWNLMKPTNQNKFKCHKKKKVVYGNAVTKFTFSFFFFQIHSSHSLSNSWEHYNFHIPWHYKFKNWRYSDQKWSL